MENDYSECYQDASMRRAVQMLCESNPDAPYIVCYVGKSDERDAQILQATNGTPKEVADGLIACLRKIGLAMGYTVNDMRMKFKVDGVDEGPERYTDQEAAYTLLAAAALEARESVSYVNEEENNE